MNKKFLIIGASLLIVWIGIHLPAVFYGTSKTPLHVSYMTADEQSPINGALHMLESKSLLEIREYRTLYYGPVFAVISIPAVLADFAYELSTGAVHDAQSFKDFIVWDWGGILESGRLISLVFSFFGLLAIYLIFKDPKVNPSKMRMAPYLAATLIGMNFMYFEYSAFLRHWIFVIVLLLWQIYFALRIFDSDEKRIRFWVAQFLFTVAIFGISYVGAIFEIFWLPLLLFWIYKKERQYLKRFVQYSVASLLGAGSIIWWYPYGFVRTLSLIGLTEPPTSQGAVLDLTGTATSHSFLFYLQVIFNNNLFLIILGVLAVVILYMNKEALHKKIWAWVFLCPAVLNFLIFGIPSHHESRYALVSVIFGIVLAFYFYLHLPKLDKPKLMMVANIFVCLYLAFNIAQIIGWERMILAGPPERREVLPQVIKWQKEDPNSKILAFRNWPLGWVHSKMAYEDFVRTHGKDSYNLWNYILGLDAPKELVPINVYYRPLGGQVTKNDLRMYDHIIVHNPGKIDSDIWDGSPNDQFDLVPWSIWKYEDYQEKYEIIK